MAATYIKIQTITLASAGSITFSNIPQTYKHLVVVGTANSTGAGGFNMSINQYTNFYQYDTMFLEATSAPFQYGVDSTGGTAIGGMSISSTGPAWAGIEIIIPDYTNTNFFPTYLYRGGGIRHDSTSGHQNAWGGGSLRQPGPVTSVGLYMSSNQLNTDTKFTLYGLS
jgi:hypothetical protein